MKAFKLILKRQLKSFVLLFVFINSIVFNNQIFSQDSISSIGINSKFGGYFSNQFRFGQAFGFELQTKYKKMFYSLEYLEMNELQIVFGQDPLEKHHAFSGLIGKSFGDRFFKIQLQSGLIGVFGKIRTDKYLGDGHPWGGGTFESEKYYSFGIPLRIGMKCVPTRFSSFGIDIHGFVTNRYSFLLPMLSVELGLLRRKIKIQKVGDLFKKE